MRKSLPFEGHVNFMRASLRGKPPDSRLPKNRTNSFQEGLKNPISPRLFGEFDLITLSLRNKSSLP